MGHLIKNNEYANDSVGLMLNAELIVRQ